MTAIKNPAGGRGVHSFGDGLHAHYNPLAPNFEAFPEDLRARPRWVTWRDKVPYCATAANSKASATDPDTWATFDDAHTAYDEGGWHGVGFVLNGDGIAGIDLDKCVNDGKPAPKAMQLLDAIGCDYIELSPSGTGLRGFGYADPLPSGKRGQVDGVNVELYSSKRYLTVTGHALKNGPILPLTGFAAMADRIAGSGTHTRARKSTQDDISHPVLSCVGIPPDCLPTSVGQRNFALFRFARWLKGKHPDATRAQLHEWVTRWHQQALPIIRTKPFAASWSEFLRQWEAVKVPHGSVLADILRELPPLPDGIAELGYGSHGDKLVQICLALAEHHAPKPFYLGSRAAGEQLGIDYSDAAAIMRLLRRDKVVELVAKGAGRKASTYRFIWEQAHD